MLALIPQDIIYHISTFIGIDYIWDDSDDSTDCDTNDLLVYNGEGAYYPLHYLYATCKAFQWLLNKEFIHIDTGEYYSHIVTKNINGQWNGMFYNFNKKIYGYAYYHHNKYTYKNTWSTDCHYFYRHIDDKDVQSDCSRAYGIPCIYCEYCPLLDKVTDYVKEKDVLISDILNNYQSNKVFMRDISNFNIQSIL
jgi:hypothetical protein